METPTFVKILGAVLRIKRRDALSDSVFLHYLLHPPMYSTLFINCLVVLYTRACINTDIYKYIHIYKRKTVVRLCEQEVSVPKLKERAGRFGEVLATKLKEEQAIEQVSTEQSARQRRAARFGLPTGADGSETAAATDGTRKRTAAVAEVGAADAPNAEQLAKRASRFGLPALNGDVGTGASKDDERKRARASRFGAAAVATPENGGK